MQAKGMGMLDSKKEGRRENAPDLSEIINVTLGEHSPKFAVDEYEGKKKRKGKGS